MRVDEHEEYLEERVDAILDRSDELDAMLVASPKDETNRCVKEFNLIEQAIIDAQGAGRVVILPKWREYYAGEFTHAQRVRRYQ